MNPLRTLLSIFPHPLHAFMSQGRIYVYVSDGPHLENRQPFHDFIFGTRQFRQPLQGRRISRVPKTTIWRCISLGVKIKKNKVTIYSPTSVSQVYVFEKNNLPFPRHPLCCKTRHHQDFLSRQHNRSPVPHLCKINPNIWWKRTL